MAYKLLSAIGVSVFLAAEPLVAQEIDPGRSVEALAVLDGGRILVRNGDETLDCALSPTASAIQLADCQPRTTAADAASVISALTDEEWKAIVRDTLLDAQCRLSAFGVVADVIATAADANGVPPETIDRVRAELSERAEAAVDRMLREGRLTYRDGELALDECP